MKRTVWTFGLIAGAILSAMMVLTLPFQLRIGPERGMIIGYTTMVLAFMLVYFGVRSYRDNVAGGSIGFGRAMAVGMLIVLVASVIYVATWQLVYFQLAPGYGAQMQAHMMERAQAGGGTPQELARKVAEVQRFWQMYQNPAFNAAVTFLEPLPVGLVFALVTAGVLSRRRRGTAPGEAAPVVMSGATASHALHR